MSLTARDVIDLEMLKYIRASGKKPADFIAQFSSYIDGLRIYDNLPPIVKAWTSWQIATESPLRYYRSEKMGDFIYNEKLFKPVRGFSKESIQYIGPLDDTFELPIGIRNCTEMFTQRVFPDGFKFKESIDWSQVEVFDGMFDMAKFNGSFSLGDNFNTESAISMNSMFRGCHLPSGFSLGSKFKTSKVQSMCSMFEATWLPQGFYLDDNFSLESVKSISSMFSRCKLNSDFHLSKNFQLTGKCDDYYVFSETTIDHNIFLCEFGKEFVSKEHLRIFENATVPSACGKRNDYEVLEALESYDFASRLDYCRIQNPVDPLRYTRWS